MSPHESFALRDYLGPDLTGRTISDARRVVSLTDSLAHTCLSDRLFELSGRSVLLAVSDQLISGPAMTEIDGVARRFGQPLAALERPKQRLSRTRRIE